MEGFKLVVMNYATSEILVFKFERSDFVKLRNIYGFNLSFHELIGNYVQDNFKESEISWMTSEEIKISNLTPTII